jgi:hypothetical protein
MSLLLELRSPTWTPTATGLAIVAWFETGPASCFTDTGGLTPVTVDGDLVAAIRSNDGSIIATQSTSGARPIYRTGSGKPYLEFDGSRFLVSSSPINITDGSGQHSAIAATYFSNNTGVQSVIDADDLSFSRVSQLLRNNAGALEVIAFNTAVGTATDSGGSITAATPVVVSEITTGTTTESFINGTGSGGSTGTSGTPQSGTARLTVGAFDAGATAFLTGRVYGFAIWKGVLDSTNHASAVPYFQALYPSTGAITATASPSLASFTTTSTAKVLVKAAAPPALATFSLASVTKVKVKASATPALNTFLSAAAAKALVHGLGSGTLNAFTSTAVAKVKVKASASPSLANFTASSTGAVKVKAAASITPNAFTSAAADRILVKGAGSGILSAFGTTSTARVKVKAAAAPTLGLFTTTAVADVISANINAAASITLSPFISAAAAKALVEGIGSGTLNQFTASATAKAKVRADASLVLDAFTGTAQAAVRIKAAATISCGPFTLTARLASLSDYPAGPFSDERVAIVGRGSRQAAVANDSGLRIAKVARRA